MLGGQGMGKPVHRRRLRRPQGEGDGRTAPAPWMGLGPNGLLKAYSASRMGSCSGGWGVAAGVGLGVGVGRQVVWAPKRGPPVCERGLLNMAVEMGKGGRRGPKACGCSRAKAGGAFGLACAPKAQRLSSRHGRAAGRRQGSTHASCGRFCRYCRRQCAHRLTTSLAVVYSRRHLPSSKL